MPDRADLIDELAAEGETRAPGFGQLVDAALRRRETARTRPAPDVPLTAMAVTAKKLDVQLGDLVEIEGRRYRVVPGKHGGLALEPAITTTAAELDKPHGTRRSSQQEIDSQRDLLPSDGDG